MKVVIEKLTNSNPAGRGGGGGGKVGLKEIFKSYLCW